MEAPGVGPFPLPAPIVQKGLWTSNTPSGPSCSRPASIWGESSSHFYSPWLCISRRRCGWWTDSLPPPSTVRAVVLRLWEDLFPAFEFSFRLRDRPFFICRHVLFPAHTGEDSSLSNGCRIRQFSPETLIFYLPTLASPRLIRLLL